MTDAASTSRTVAVVNKPPAPHPVTTLPIRKTVALGARPVNAHPIAKAVVQVIKRFVGLNIVASRPMSGFVQDEAIYVGFSCIDKLLLRNAE